jgi:toxin secretion/phage lysis holin
MNTKLFILAFGFAPILSFIEKYIWDDWSFLMFMVLLVAIDTASGTLYAIKEHQFSSKKMQPLLIKIVVYGLTLITVHIMSAFTVKNQPNTMIADILPYLDSIMYSFLVFREVLSINENLGKLGYPMLPKFVLKRFADFDENGAPIKKNDNNNSTPTNGAN